ncbi:MAG: hypothetical protein KZQ78_04340 [Candidatus Thiodiazotropha sp. (ex Ustalcina ferruginea)]|nr:hypothetical protein [Candidatus Thiodiazotropha sp. (ex Ustalcina ferruginea)]
MAGTATEGEDYSAVTADTLTFNPGETGQSVAVTLLQDSLSEGPEALSLVLANAGGSFIFDSVGEMTILDDEINPCGAPPYDSSIDQALFVWKDCTSGSWHVRATAGGDPAGVRYTGAVTSNASLSLVAGVSLESSDSLDYTSDPTRIEYLLNIWNNGEDGYQFTPVNGVPTCLRPTAPSGVQVLVGPERQPLTGPFDLESLGQCLNLDINDVVVSEADGVASFTVSLSGPSERVGSVDYETQSGTATGAADYTEVALPLTLTFNPGETSKRVDITILQDTLAEGSETFTVALSGPVNVTLGDASGLATILDDETNACGAPSYNTATEKALFVWKDCQTGEWFVRNTAGGDPAGVFYEGQVFTSQGFVNVAGFGLEASDTLDNTSDPAVIDFLLKVWNKGEDGISVHPTLGHRELPGPVGSVRCVHSDGCGQNAHFGLIRSGYLGGVHQSPDRYLDQ